MKRYLLILVFLLFLCGCSNDDYENWYNAGYQAGYNAAREDLSSRTVPTDAPTQAPDEITVYVSRSFKIHKKSNCSGMTVYTEMTLSQAESFGYEKCKKCWK